MRPESNPSSDYAGYYKVVAPLVMCKGVGDGKTTACVMAQAATIDALRKGKTLDEPTDEMECACPLLRRMAINANDANWWSNDHERTEALRPLIPLLLDSRVSSETIKKRAARFSNAVIFELTPMRLEWIASNTKNKEYAQKCREGIKAISEITLITDKASALKARHTLSALKSSADADADVYADASADAYASAYASADASADVYVDAYVYAYVYAYASADADAQRVKYRDAYLALFRELAAIRD